MSGTLWIHAELLGNRLDYERNQPQFSEAERRVRQASRLRLATFEDARDPNAPINNSLRDMTHALSSAGVPVLRATNIQSPWIDDADILKIDPSIEASSARSRLRAQDIVISIAGTLGDVGIVPRCLEGANINSSLARFRAAQPEDAYYFVAFVCTETGRHLLLREAVGSVQRHLNLEDIPNVLLPRAPARLEKAIGNKVRKAERLREMCTSHWNSAVDCFERSAEIPLSTRTYKYVDAQSITSKEFHCVSVDPPVSWATPTDSVAAQYFHPRRVRAQQIAGARLHWAAFGELATSKRKKEKGVTPARCIGLDQIDSSLGVVRADGTGSDQDQPSGIVYRPRDILFSRLRPYLNKVAIWPEHWESGTGSGELLVYEATSSIEANYLFFVLKSPLGLYQVIDVTAGSTLPRVDSGVIEEIRVPRLQADVEQQIATLVFEAHRAWYQSQELIPKAAQDVAALIDGSLDERQLLAEGEEIEKWLNQNSSPAVRRS